MQKRTSIPGNSFFTLWALTLLLIGAKGASVNYVFFNCSLSTTQYFSQSQFSCIDCGTNQVTDGWKSCKCSPNFKTTNTARQAAPGISYGCTACDWNSDNYCPPATASQCTTYTTLKRIAGYEEVSPLVCMPCSYGAISEYSCQCPASTSTTKYAPAYPNQCIQVDPSIDLRATWQVIGNQQSLLFKCNLQKVIRESPVNLFLQTWRSRELFWPGKSLRSGRLSTNANCLQNIFRPSGKQACLFFRL